MNIRGYAYLEELLHAVARPRNIHVLLIITIVIMASMVIVLRGKSQQTTVLDVSNLNSLESSYYVRLNNTIWQDPLNNASQWQIGYSQPNMKAAGVSVNGDLYLNATFASEQYPQAVNLYRSVNVSLAQNPVLLISLEASVGIHYGIRIAGQDTSGNPFQAWSESSNLQHRPGPGQVENFSINVVLEAYKVNGVFPTAGSNITSLSFYIEATPGQTGQFSLKVHRITVVSPNQYPFNAANPVIDEMDGISLTLNFTSSLGFTDDQFAQGFIDYYVSGTQGLIYTVYYTHGLTVLGQGFDYSASAMTYNIASFSASKVSGYPSLIAGNNTFSIVLAPSRGAFLAFQLEGFSVRYLSQAPMTSTPADINASTILAYYLIFLFVTPVAIVILVSRLFSHETNQAS